MHQVKAKLEPLFARHRAVLSDDLIDKHLSVSWLLVKDNDFGWSPLLLSLGDHDSSSFSRFDFAPVGGTKNYLPEIEENLTPANESLQCGGK